MKVAIYVIPIALAIYALVDLYRSEPDERADLQPLLWVLIVLLLPVLGPLVWIFVSRTRRAERSPGPTRPRGPWPTRRPRTGPTAPDDDAEFLRQLDQQWKRDPGAGPTPPDADPPAA